MENHKVTKDKEGVLIYFIPLNLGILLFLLQ